MTDCKEEIPILEKMLNNRLRKVVDILPYSSISENSTKSGSGN